MNLKEKTTGDGQEFSQSIFWQELMISEGGQTWREGNADFAFLASKNKLFGKYCYFYFPRGPELKGIGGEREKAQKIINIWQDKARKENVVFFRIEPSQAAWIALQEAIKQTGWPIKKSIDLQPAQTLVLDLHKEEKELLRAMNQKTRYNIRLAEKKGIKIEIGSVRDFSEFWRLMKSTGQRDNFGIHKEEHYKKLLTSTNDKVELWLAKMEGRVIAAGIFSFFGKKATYLHGASDYHYRNLMAPYLLQWRLIQEARNRGFSRYDFYGVSEKKWPGVTRFKLGFGGEIYDYPGTYDLIASPSLYLVYQNLRSLGRMIYKIKRKLW